MPIDGRLTTTYSKGGKAKKPPSKDEKAKGQKAYFTKGTK